MIAGCRIIVYSFLRSFYRVFSMELDKSGKRRETICYQAQRYHREIYLYDINSHVYLPYMHKSLRDGFKTDSWIIVVFLRGLYLGDISEISLSRCCVASPQVLFFSYTRALVNIQTFSVYNNADVFMQQWYLQWPRKISNDTRFRTISKVIGNLCIDCVWNSRYRVRSSTATTLIEKSYERMVNNETTNFTQFW